jgi:hypothetical protein
MSIRIGLVSSGYAPQGYAPMGKVRDFAANRQHRADWSMTTQPVPLTVYSDYL